MDCRGFSIEYLLRLSFQHGLVTDYHISPSMVSLIRNGEEILSSDPEEARIYLQGLLAGRAQSTGLIFSQKPAGPENVEPRTAPEKEKSES
jgi:hypothetical protein